MTEASKTYVDLYKLITEGDVSQNYAMNDGDYLFVEKALPFTITGEVKSPNQYPAHRGLTVQQAVALAGGLTDRAKSNGSGIKILRAGGDPKTSKPIEVKDWTKELVKPGDTITVPARIL
jgi:polysaccharide export outer membrane protein